MAKFLLLKSDLCEESPMENEVKIKISGGYLVAGVNPDPEYPGVYLCFEKGDGAVLDLAMAESPIGTNEISTYIYEDIYDEGWTRKFSLKISDIYKALDF